MMSPNLHIQLDDKVFNIPVSVEKLASLSTDEEKSAFASEIVEMEKLTVDRYIDMQK